MRKSLAAPGREFGSNLVYDYIVHKYYHTENPREILASNIICNHILYSYIPSIIAAPKILDPVLGLCVCFIDIRGKGFSQSTTLFEKELSKLILDIRRQPTQLIGWLPLVKLSGDNEKNHQDALNVTPT